ncbi:MAG: S8 family serine peptidase, partial [Pseudomonadota bacterium]
MSDAYIPNDTLYPEQPYLPFINCDEAWDTLDDVSVALRGGSPTICIGVLDSDGVTPDHPDLTDMLTDGTAKLITSFNFQTMQPERPTDGFQDYHGTQVAGTATAAFDNTRGIAGVAPNCHLVGGRLPGGFDDLELADVLLWSAGIDAGNTDPAFPALPAQPADVIINSWGSNTPLSNIMRDCFDYLTTYGRDGRGCVVCFSIGNDGFEPFTNVRRYAAYDRTIAVGASIGPNPTSPVRSFYPDPDGNTEDLVAVPDTRAFYSTYGPELDLVAPSSTSKTRGGDIDEVMSAVRVGEGSFSGLPQPPDMPPLEIEEDYDRSFGGTSHACPIVGGTAALILSANPALNWLQVRQILRETAVPIDTANTHPTGVWVDTDGDGVPDFSQWYGHGRVDVNAAVTAALAVGAVSDVVVRENLNDTGAVPSPGWHASSPDIWVRANDDPIPALPYTAAPPHQNAVRGQDNFVFCRVRNTGGAPASQVHIRAMICHFPGFEFRYPQEFIPSHRPGEALPTPLTPGTYLIGEVREDDLMPGESRIVKMTWPAALIPPQTVEVGGLDVSWHPCLLLEASPHDGEVAPPGSAIDIRRYNNICQR